MLYRQELKDPHLLRIHLVIVSRTEILMAYIERAFRQRFLGIVQSAIREANEASRLGHPGLIGRLREICVTRILKHALPPEVKCGSGKLTDAKGNLSAEIDVILYAPGILPPALYDENNGLFPVESCLYTIEVKSRLSASDIKSAIENAQSVRNLSLLPAEYWNGREGRVAPNVYPVCALFAFGSDLGGKGKSEIERYRECDSTANADSRIKAICTRGSGYWYEQTADDGSVTWRQLEATPDFDEVIDFVSGVSNTIPQLLAGKGSTRFGKYLSNDEPYRGRIIT